MPDCVYVGDSIAVGLEQFDTNCAVYARVGANTDYIARNYVNRHGERYTVISMGSNWPDNPRNYRNMLNIRRNIDTGTVVWILPYNRTAAATARRVASQYGDSFIDLSSYRSNDNVHPSYRSVSRAIRNRVR